MERLTLTVRQSDTAKRKGGRPRTGSVWWHQPDVGPGHYDVQITLPNGKRSNPACMPPEMSESMARVKAAKWTADAAAGRLELASSLAPSSPAGESADKWFARYFVSQVERGHTSVRANRGRWRKWCSGRLGRIAMTAIRKDDLEALVEDLDACVRLEALSWKTAKEAWSLLTKAFGEASGSKVRALRVLEANPAAGVRGPDVGAKKAKQFVYPSEHVELVGQVETPLRWRRVLVIATYAYLRAAELRGLEWPDLDLEHRVIHLHRTVDEHGDVQTLKGEEARRVPIEATLLPLLLAMHQAAGGVGRVVPDMPSEDHLSTGLRRYLEAAGVTREELYTTDATRRAIRFHDLRASGITWRAVRGDPALAIMQAAGHKDMKTTIGYVRTAEAVGAAFGTPFPPLPPDLFEVSQDATSDRVVEPSGGGGSSETVVAKAQEMLRIQADVRGFKSPPSHSVSVDVDTRNESPPAPSCETSSETPRAGVLEDLARHKAEARAVGDLGLVQMLHRWEGELLGELGASASKVTDLASRRRRR